MKKILFVAMMVFTASTAVNAQSAAESRNGMNLSHSANSETRPLYERLLFEGSMSASTRSCGTSIADLSLKIGYRFTPQFYAFAQAGADLALCKNGGTRTWNSSNHFGVGLGYTIYNNKGKDNWDVRASWAHSIGNTSWKQSQYESSVVYSPRRKGAATFALGYKHIHSHSSWMPHLNIVYGAIGFRF